MILLTYQYYNFRFFTFTGTQVYKQFWLYVINYSWG